MGGPVGWWRLHGGRVDGLHGQRGVAEAIEVLDGRLVLGIKGGSVGPGGGVVLVGVLVVVVLVVHLQRSSRRARSAPQKLLSRWYGSVRGRRVTGRAGLQASAAGGGAGSWGRRK